MTTRATPCASRSSIVPAVAHAAADLQLHRALRGELLDQAAIDQRAVARAVQIHHVQPARTELRDSAPAARAARAHSASRRRSRPAAGARSGRRADRWREIRCSMSVRAQSALTAQEIAQQARAGGGGALGMKLHAAEVAAPDHGGQRLAVVARVARVCWSRYARRSCARSRRSRRGPVRPATDPRPIGSSVFQPMCGTGRPGPGVQLLDASRAAHPGSACRPRPSARTAAACPGRCPAAAPAAAGSADPGRARCSRRMASAAAPTPGSSTRGAAAMAAGSAADE